VDRIDDQLIDTRREQGADLLGVIVEGDHRGAIRR
jgi:hypothetical protein